MKRLGRTSKDNTIDEIVRIASKVDDRVKVKWLTSTDVLTPAPQVL
jgi:hypothetical protein